MNIIHSGFDTIVFALKGAAKAKSLDHMQFHKDIAEKAQCDQPISFNNGKVIGMIADKGQQGGYRYVLKLGGDLGHIISIKRNVDRLEWNGYVKIRALALACYGWEEAVRRVFKDLGSIGFYHIDISLNRIDYAIDFLNPDLELNPANVVAHSRAGKVAHNIKINALTRGQSCESITIGKMPNRQVIIYDKRAEVVSKRTLAWFKIWGLDRRERTISIYRTEMRAGKDHLVKNEIRNFDDLRAKGKNMFSRDVRAIRYVDRADNDTNVSRWPNHSIWNHVQAHVQNHMFNTCKHVDIDAVEHVVLDQKIHMHTANALGNLAPVSIYLDMDPEHMVEQMVTYVREQLEDIATDDTHSFWKARARTGDRLHM